MKSKYISKNIIGCDETGVGDYFSPLVAAAVYVPLNIISEFEAMGITDSKKLTSQQIARFAMIIKEKAKYSISYMSQAQYNFLTNKKHNAHVLKTILHLSAINFLEEQVSDIDLVIIDEYANMNLLAKYIDKLISTKFEFKYKKLLPIKAEHMTITKGESEHIAVACASIIARDKLLFLMKMQNAKWKTTFPLGATTSIMVPFGKKFIENNDSKDLYQVAKLSFKTTVQIKSNN